MVVHTVLHMMFILFIADSVPCLETQQNLQLHVYRKRYKQSKEVGSQQTIHEFKAKRKVILHTL